MIQTTGKYCTDKRGLNWLGSRLFIKAFCSAFVIVDSSMVVEVFGLLVLVPNSQSVVV